MKKNDVMMYAMIAGGAYLLYWYLTKNGPNGAAFNAAGQQVNLSYWDSWFGGAQAATTTTAAQPPPSTGASPANQPPMNNPPVTVVVAQPVDVRSKLLTATGGQNNLNADQWNYYRNQLFPPALSGAAFGAAFPVRTDPMPALSVDQFLASLQAAGINAAAPGSGGSISGLGRIGSIINVPSVASIPSMSFGGSLAQSVPGSPSAFRGSGRGNRGGYIQ